MKSESYTNVFSNGNRCTMVLTPMEDGSIKVDRLWLKTGDEALAKEFDKWMEYVISDFMDKHSATLLLRMILK